MARRRGLHADLRRLRGGARIRHRTQMARMPPDADRADLDESHPGLSGPARARHAKIVLSRRGTRTFDAANKTEGRICVMILLRTGAVLLFGLLSGAVQAQSYPARPITIVAPFPPGASTDFIARLLREPLADALGQSVIIENRPGAGGTTGTAAVANAAPDGYTLLVTVNAPVTMNVYMQKNFPFDPRTALAPITMAAEVVLVLAVNSSVPVRTVPELIDYARQNRDKKLSYASAGIGSAHHIAGELLKKKTGIDMLHVPYRGGAPAVQDLVAGHVPIGFGTTPAVLPQAAAGSIRIVALAEAKRSPDMPDVPTIAETVPGVVTATWVGVFAPAGTPKAIIERLNKIIVDALRRPDILEKLKQQGAIAVGSTPEQLGERITAELASWGQIIPSIGIQPE